jgi:MFS family permease
MLLNGLPVLMAKWIADKKVKRIDFYSWIFVACYTLLYICWLIIAGIIATILGGWQYAAILLPVMIATGIFSYAYIGWYRNYRQYKKFNRLSQEQKNVLRNLRSNAQKPIQ